MVSRRKKQCSERNTSPKPGRKICTRNKKNQPKMKQLIEISSSYIESVPKAQINDNNIPTSPIADPNHDQEKNVLEQKVSRLESSMEIIINGLNNLTNIVASQSTMFSPASTLNTMSLMHNQSQTPRDSTVIKPSKTDEILAKLKSTINGSSSSKKKKVDKNKKISPLMDDTLRKKLFSHTISGKSCGMLAEMEPLHNVAYDGMKTSVDIPKWIPILFRPPPCIVLDDVQAVVVAYIFGSNKDDDINGKEVIMTTTTTYADRNTLKTLMPKGLVDQEVLNVLVSILTCQERSIGVNAGDASFWYMPTLIAQFALGWTKDPGNVRDFYQDDYMGKVDYLRKVDNVTRMQLVLDLVLSSHNAKRDELIKDAAANWKNLEDKNKRLVVY
ncbi:Ulp1 protease family, carboxy-terminal domain protein [Spatholobus suberectus]|nr:Ulp1 protease family, carboxy-terminal domain protein [Spatholobus suberectus]